MAAPRAGRGGPVDSGVVDDLARRYLLLGLRLERLAPGVVDSYVGPDELAEVVAAEPPPLAAELHDDALRLRELAAALPGDDPATDRRRRWFEGQLLSMAAQARRAAGEEIAFLDLTDQLFGTRVTPVPEDELRAQVHELDAALAGGGPLLERIEAHRERLLVPAERKLAVLVASAERFRAITRRDFVLPEQESIDWEAAHDVPWGAFALFSGAGRTRIRINLDLRGDIPTIAYLASHEAYPGHHAEHVVKERTLIRHAGLGEATLRTMNTPEALLAEGQADVAREVVMGDWELEAELARIGREVGIEADWGAVGTVSRASFALSGAIANAAILLHHEERPAAEVRSWLEAYSPQAPDQLDHLMRVLRDPLTSTYVFTYREGARLVRRWLELQGQTTGFWRLLSEQLSPAALAHDLDTADAILDAR